VSVVTTTSERARTDTLRPETSRLARILVRVVRLYQLARGSRPSPCRYLPTCSEFAAEAIERHGAGRGAWLALRRVLRCHPWGGRGVDPVPD
jgi:putative membrane protein insertion efficiency factor